MFQINNPMPKWSPTNHIMKQQSPTTRNSPRGQIMDQLRTQICFVVLVDSSLHSCRWFLYPNIKWAVTCDFQQCGILTWLDSDEPAQPSFKLGNSKCCSISSLTLIEYSSDEQRLWSDCAYAQADLSLCWSYIPHCWKSHVAAQMCIEDLINELGKIDKMRGLLSILSPFRNEFKRFNNTRARMLDSIYHMTLSRFFLHVKHVVGVSDKARPKPV